MKLNRKLFLTFIFSVCFMFGQSSKYEIEGIVQDFVTTQPISQAEVRLIPYAGKIAVLGNPDLATHATHSDDSGKFHFTVESPGMFQVEVHKDGYTADGSTATTFKKLSIEVSDKTNPGRITVKLFPQSRLTGVVMDDNTKKPLQNFTVTAFEAIYLQGKRIAIPTNHRSITDREGEFNLIGLPANDYYLQITEANGKHEKILTTFSSGDVEKVDRAYKRTLNPSMMEQPIHLMAGSIINLGSIFIEASELYRAEFRLEGASCDGNEVRFNLNQNLDVAYAGRASQKAICPGNILITGLIPNEDYQVESQIRGPDDKLIASDFKNIRVFNTNIQERLTISPGPNITGQVSIAGSAGDTNTTDSMLPQGLEIYIRPAWGLAYSKDGNINIDKDGAFSIKNIRAGDQEVRLLGLSEDFCIREVRYNGSAVPINRIPINPYAMAHHLEIELENQPALVSGQVIHKETPEPESSVILVEWDTTESRDLFHYKEAETDPKGNFTMKSIRPSTYRIVAVPRNQKEKLQRPNILENIMRTAQDITLKRGENQNLQLKMTLLQ